MHMFLQFFTCGHFGSSDRLTSFGQVFIPPSLTLKMNGAFAASFDDVVPCQVLSSEQFTPPPWDRWSLVPRDPDLLLSLGPWCLEIFSGKAGVTRALKQKGLRVLPPIDITVEGEVREPVDILDADLFDFVLLLVQIGAVDFLHLGTPCGTFSIARTRPGGPPPLRSEVCSLRFPELEGQLWWQLWSGNEFLARPLLLMEAVVKAGGDTSLENPLSSLMWKVPWVQQLARDLHLFEVDMDQCEYGAPSMKPTRFLVSHSLFKRWRRQCREDHPHVPLQGFVRDARGRKVFATKLAQVYPDRLCDAVASSVFQVIKGNFLSSRPRSP